MTQAQQEHSAMLKLGIIFPTHPAPKCEVYMKTINKEEKWVQFETAAGSLSPSKHGPAMGRDGPSVKHVDNSACAVIANSPVFKPLHLVSFLWCNVVLCNV